MACSIRFVAVPDAVPGIADPTWIKMTNAWEGWWLLSYDPDAYDGIGRAAWTENAQDALRFDSEFAARQFWASESKRRTRPLSQISITIDDPDQPVWDPLASVPLRRADD